VRRSNFISAERPESAGEYPAPIGSAAVVAQSAPRAESTPSANIPHVLSARGSTSVIVRPPATASIPPRCTELTRKRPPFASYARSSEIMSASPSRATSTGAPRSRVAEACVARSALAAVAPASAAYRDTIPVSSSAPIAASAPIQRDAPAVSPAPSASAA